MRSSRFRVILIIAGRSAQFLARMTGRRSLVSVVKGSPAAFALQRWRWISNRSRLGIWLIFELTHAIRRSGAVVQCPLMAVASTGQCNSLTGAAECRACPARSAGWSAQLLRYYFLSVLKQAFTSSRGQGQAKDIGRPERAHPNSEQGSCPEVQSSLSRG